MVSTAAADRFLATPILAELDSATRQALLNVLVEERAEEGTILLRQGQPNDHISFLIEGTATVFRTRPGAGTETLTDLTAPSLFGLTSFFRPTPPGFSVRATSPVLLLNFDHDAHELLRRVDRLASETLALAAVRVLADRFDLLDHRVSEDMAQHPEDHPKSTEWAIFRSKLFEESSL